MREWYLTVYLEQNKLIPIYQSAYRKNYSTETAILDVLSHVYKYVDSGDVTLLGLLDLSSAFDCVDHHTLLNRLQRAYGFTGQALDWFTSFLDERKLVVSFNGRTSRSASLDSGVPQGSVLGSLLFVLYTADVQNIAHRCGFNIQSYADDTQLLGHCTPSLINNFVDKLICCINDINRWMSSNFLKLNSDKTQLLMLGTQYRLKIINVNPVYINGSHIVLQQSAVDLGVTIDSELTMQPHIKSIVKSCSYQLRQLWSIRKCITTVVAKTLAQSFVCSKIDYCNSILYGVSQTNLRCLQSVLNGAARFVTQRRKFDHISHVMRDDLHWLPISQRIEFKICSFTYKCIHGLAPSYLMNYCVGVSSDGGRSRLRSAVRGDLVVPRVKSTLGSRSFAVAGPKLWNSLPCSMRDPSLSFDIFRKMLKTHLFRIE